MKNRWKRKILIFILINITVTALGTVFYVQFKDNEYVKVLSGNSIALLSASYTLIVVWMTFENNEKLSKKDEKKNIRLIKRILRTNIEKFLLILHNNFLEMLESRITKSKYQPILLDKILIKTINEDSEKYIFDLFRLVDDNEETTVFKIHQFLSEYNIFINEFSEYINKDNEEGLLNYNTWTKAFVYLRDIGMISKEIDFLFDLENNYNQIHRNKSTNCCFDKENKEYLRKYYDVEKYSKYFKPYEDLIESLENDKNRTINIKNTESKILLSDHDIFNYSELYDQIVNIPLEKFFSKDIEEILKYLKED